MLHTHEPRNANYAAPKGLANAEIQMSNAGYD
jgi:hypothetical protein